MRKFTKITSLVVLLGIIAFASSCDVADELGFTTDLPKTYLGAWVDSNDNEIIVKSGNITYEGEVLKFQSISDFGINGEDVYTIVIKDPEDEDNVADFYMKQTGSTDELQVSTFTATQSFVTYTKVQ